MGEKKANHEFSAPTPLVQYYEHVNISCSGRRPISFWETFFCFLLVPAVSSIMQGRSDPLKIRTEHDYRTLQLFFKDVFHHHWEKYMLDCLMKKEWQILADIRVYVY